MSHYTMLFKYGNCTRLLKIKKKQQKKKPKLKIVFFFFANKVGKNSWYFVGVFNQLLQSRLLDMRWL